LGAFPARSAGNRAIRLYLFCLRQKRIPLLSLALLNAQSALSLGVLLRKTPGNVPLGSGFGFAEFHCVKLREKAFQVRVSTVGTELLITFPPYFQSLILMKSHVYFR
jgi:hypothetical protein